MTPQNPYEPRTDNAPRQGTIYRNVQTVLPESPVGVHVDLVLWELPYAVALSQECDLLQDQKIRALLQNSSEDVDIKHDKLLPTILLCPAYQATAFRTGDHLSGLGRKMESHNSKQRSIIEQNNNPRYHYLVEWREYQVPELVLDFKHFFVMPTELMINHYGSAAHFVARLAPLYREDLSHRFSAYLGRIGLPISHHEFKNDENALAAPSQADGEYG